MRGHLLFTEKEGAPSNSPTKKTDFGWRYFHKRNQQLRLGVLKDSFSNKTAERKTVTSRGSLREGAGAVGD